MRLEILHQRRAGLIDIMCHFVEILGQSLSRAAVAVPVRVVQLHEPRAALNQAPRQEAVIGKTRFTRLDTVQVEGRL